MTALPHRPTVPLQPHQRVVLVTGAAKRLGREIALALARAGWVVAVHYRSSGAQAMQTVADCEQQGVPSELFRAELSEEAEVSSLVPRVVAHFGRIDAVVNSASTFELDHASDFSFENMERHLRANTGAAIILARDLHAHHLSLPALAPTITGGKRQLACVVNLLDQKLWNPNPDFLSYTLSKAALEAANTLLALALAPLVRVVGVAPGLTLTSHLLSADQFRELHQLGPLGTGSNAADVAQTVVFALGNNSITGTTILVDAGQHLQRFERDFSLM